MRKYLYIPLIACSMSFVSAEEVLYQSDFAKLKPEENLFKPDKQESERQNLFPDAKPACKMKLNPRKDRFVGSVKAIGTKEGALKLVPVAGKKYPLRRYGELLLSMTKARNNVTVQFTVKPENFLKRKKRITSFFILQEFISGSEEIVRI